MHCRPLGTRSPSVCPYSLPIHCNRHYSLANIVVSAPFGLVLHVCLSVQVLVDDVLVYRGCLRKSPSQADLARAWAMGDADADTWGTADKLDLSQSILFSNDENIVQREVL